MQKPIQVILRSQLFGDFDTDAAPHKNILSYISEGKGMNAYVFIEKIKIQKELQKLP